MWATPLIILTVIVILYYPTPGLLQEALDVSRFFLEWNIITLVWTNLIFTHKIVQFD